MCAVIQSLGMSGSSRQRDNVLCSSARMRLNRSGPLCLYFATNN